MTLAFGFALLGAIGPALRAEAGAARTRNGEIGGGTDFQPSTLVAAGHAGRGTATGGVPVDSHLFEPGACVAFAPKHRNLHRTVFLDAGHGSIDPGGEGSTQTGRTIYESPSNLAIELETMHLLVAEGFRVVVSRTISTEVARLTPTDRTGTLLSVQGARADVAARDACANRAHSALLVGIYLDADTTPQDAGCLTAYDTARPFASKSKRFASLLQSDVVARLNGHGWQIPNDGAEPDTTLGGLPLTTTAAAYHHLLLLGPDVPGWFTTASLMPGALIEPLFISDPYEGSIAVGTAGREAIAEGTAQAVEQYFHVAAPRSSRSSRS